MRAHRRPDPDCCLRQYASPFGTLSMW